MDLPTTTRFGRQIKVPKEAQAAALAESEKQTKARQRKKEQAKKEQAKKDQNSTTLSHETYKAVSQVTQKNATTPNPSVAGVMVCTRSASIYHTPNNGSLYHTPLRGIDRILRKVEANTVVLTGVKCPTCGRVMPSRMPVTPTNTHSASQSTANSNTSINWNSEQTITGTAASSSLKLAPVTVRQPPLTAPWSIELPPSASHASSKPDATGHVNTTATLSEAMTGTQDSAQAQAAPARCGRIYLRARGAKGNRGDARERSQGRDGETSAPITIVIPARPRPVTPASTVAPPTSASTTVIAPTDAVKCDPSRRSTRGADTTSTHSANPVPTTVASSEARVPTESVRPGSMAGGADHEVAVAAFAHAYYSRCNTKQTVAAGSRANAAANSTKNTHVCTSGPSGAFTFGSTSTGAHYPRSTTSTAANAAASPSRGKAIDFSDPKLWITRARAVGGLPGLSDFAAQMSGSVATNRNRVHTTVASSVNTRGNKKRKLDNSE